MDIPREPKSRKGRYIGIGLAVAALVVVSLYLKDLEPAAPTVDANILWTGTVERGSFLRQVRGGGSLVPEDIVYISAVTSGRIQEVLVRAGAETGPGTVLLRLENPDVQLDYLDAQRQYTVAQSELVQLKGQLETQILDQQAAVARTRNQLRDAQRQLAAYREVPEEVSKLAMQRTEDQVEELTLRLEIEEKTLEFRQQGRDIEIQAQESQVARLKELAEFQRNRLESMNVRAGIRGVVRELDLQVGQWVNPGQRLGVIIEPGELMAKIRINETQARDVLVGQKAEIDPRVGEVVEGRVTRIDPSASGGQVTVDIEILEPLPQGARADQNIDGVITIESLDDVMYVGRPTNGQAHATIGLFKIVDNGTAAVRVSVELGRSSVDKMEVKRGLEAGDQVILSDMSRYDEFDRVRIKQ
ncbi:MAG: HlyD family efflux transporter periplasmic adaptor subunit [bacterium]